MLCSEYCVELLKVNVDKLSFETLLGSCSLWLCIERAMILIADIGVANLR
jgi:hypothetical protein